MKSLVSSARRLLAGSLVSLALAAAFAPTASAQVSSSLTGAYDNSGFYDTTWGGYRTGVYDDAYVQRGFFSFDTTAVQAGGTLSGATLQVYNPDGGFGSDGASETLEIRALDLTNISLTSFFDGSAGTDGYSALASGTLLGTATVTSAHNDGWVSITLNQDFLTWANTASTPQLVLGASLNSLSGGTTGYNEFVFGGSDGSTAAQLQLTAVPEPATTGLFLALGVLIPIALRQRRKAAVAS